MEVDKNLFLYDVAVVALTYNERNYIKEWLDYHLLSGVDHFYLYDHESTDNYREISRPYEEKGLVTDKYYPGKVKHIAAFNDAVKNFKFFCRYMTFIDDDEFLLPKHNKTIGEVIDDVFSLHPNYTGALRVYWHCFGSNNLEKADYSKGVLERFTRRAPDDYVHNRGLKVIANPRKIKYWDNPHDAYYYEGNYPVDESGEITVGMSKLATAEKIILNHYCVKSKEEFVERKMKVNSNPDVYSSSRQWDYFEDHDRNDVFDDEILKYRDARRDALNLQGGGVAVIFEQQKNKLFTSIKRVAPKSFADNKFKCSAAVFRGKNGNIFDLPRSCKPPCKS